MSPGELVDDAWEGMRFGGAWRRYQRLALDAFDADVAATRRSTHVVAPPGSGKTLIGLEMARRLGRPALVLCPTGALQSQWLRQLESFGAPPAGAGARGCPPTGAVPLRAMTYQALCRTGDPGGDLAEAARRRLAEERARALGGVTAEDVLAEFDGYAGAAARRHARDLARVTASLKREVARGQLVGRDLIAPSAARRLDELRAAGVGTVIVDECHHLLGLWGYLIRVVVAALGEGVHVIGLTATSPEELTEDEAELYGNLLGEVDFDVPTPAVVKDGYLAPYQELALFTSPLSSELDWLRERHVRFAELLDDLHRPAVGDGVLSFPEWVVTRTLHRDTAAGARISLPAFARRHPALARAGLRYLRHTGAAVPPDAPRGEGWSEPPDVDDWLVLLEDWALRGLRPAPGAAPAGQWAELAAGLADLGYTLTRSGVRPGRSDIDRVLVNSAAKTLLVCDILETESRLRGPGLRAVVLCDGEHSPAQPENSSFLLAGGARSLVRSLGADHRTDLLTPLLATGRTLACLPVHAAKVVSSLAAQLPDGVAGTLGAEDTDGLSVIRSRDPRWETALYVPAVTRLLAAGVGQVLVGTRGLLGEGWDCPSVNVLIDVTTVAASVSVRQMRGRSLRLDPDDPEKVASNWDVVCVAPDLERGKADYQRFVRRHSHLHAPGEDGSISTGVSHVHPELSPYAPPDGRRFAPINAACLSRAAEVDAVRARWQIGRPYRGVDLPALLLRPVRAPGADGGADGLVAEGPGAGPEPARRPPPPPRFLGWAAISGAAVGLGSALAHPAGIVAVLLAGLAGAGALRQSATRRRHCPPDLDLERVARAVLDAYVALDEIAPAVAGEPRFTPRPDGFLHAVLPTGTVEENARFSAALAEATDAASAQRYVVSRWAAGPTRPALAATRSLLGVGPPDLTQRWHPVPTDLGRNKTRAHTYLTAWQRWVSNEATLAFTQGDDAGRRLLLEAIASPGAFSVSRRTVWV